METIMSNNNFELIWEQLDEEIGLSKQMCISDQINNCKHDLEEIDYTYVCKLCGLVSNEKIYKDDNDIFVENKGFTYNITLSYISTYTIISNNCNTPLANKLRKTQKYINGNYKDRIIIQYKSELENYCNIYNISVQVIEPAIDILIKLKEKSLVLRGINNNALKCVCLYQSCKLVNIHIDLNLILNLFNINIKTFNKCWKICNEKIVFDNSFDITNNNISITKICNDLNVQFNILRLCEKIFNICNKINFFPNNKIDLVCYSIIKFVHKELHKNIVLDINYSIYSINKLVTKLNENKQYIYQQIKEGKQSFQFV